MPEGLIPTSALFACGAVFPHREPESRASFPRHARARLPRLQSDPAWGPPSEGRRAVSASLGYDDWAWQVAWDHDPIPAEASAAMFGVDVRAHPVQAMRSHASHAFAFLLSAPTTARAEERVRTTCELGWSFLDAGATAIFFPFSGTVIEASSLGAAHPPTAPLAELCGWLLGTSPLGRAGGNHWFRTNGMYQFDLPDLCAGNQPERDGGRKPPL